MKLILTHENLGRNLEHRNNFKKSARATIINLDLTSLSVNSLILNEFKNNEIITSLLFLLAFNDETNNKLTLNDKVKNVFVASCYDYLSKQNKYEFNTQWLYKIIDKWGAGVIQELIPRHFFSRYLLLNIIQYIGDYEIAETLFDESVMGDPKSL